MQIKGSRLASSHKTQEGTENGCTDDKIIMSVCVVFCFSISLYVSLVALDGFINNLFYK